MPADPRVFQASRPIVPKDWRERKTEHFRGFFRSQPFPFPVVTGRERERERERGLTGLRPLANLSP